MRQRLKEAGLSTPQGEAIDAVIAKENRRKRPHRHTWSRAIEGRQHCMSPHCDGHREAT